MPKQEPFANPLSLAVLVLLLEKPMHPYEMAALLRERNKEESIKLRYGSLYTVIEALHRDGLIASRETSRDGKRPERTVYELTAAGHNEMRGRLRYLVSTPVKEYPQFEAALALLPALTPGEVSPLLEERAQRLDSEIARLSTNLDAYHAQGIDPLALVEIDYRLKMLQAERSWVADLPARIKYGSWGESMGWRERHRQAAEQPQGE